ncbi:hypothetical protein KSC_044750 [Ktedonobacter sp. SOSP1-52]|uniref:hypothetical protein n=1 Tax=Ktedonobacter sp. SOSP1-52 TaxID=2778366 RepID=UPI0019154516|nr:hypothetical protein [Ktedonobacter sp. SOSP1-52]GHO65583.1 hypothetical protein KSC_044750 [Ktedonobacter sp. SOSP1-52]
MSEKRTTTTTTLLITKPTDFTLLEAKYQLLRYELPDDLRWKFKNAKKPSEMWASMQNSLQAQINSPYRVFTHDRLDGRAYHKWVIYVLAPRHTSPQPITLPLWSNGALPYKPIKFTNLAFHMVIKLLQVAQMHGNQAGRFTGQGRCYVHAKLKTKSSHICVQLDLHEDILTQEEDSIRQFKVEAQAKLFQRCSANEYLSYHETYFCKRNAADSAVYFLQMKLDEIKRLKEENGVFYKIGTIPGKKTTLAFHDLNHIEESTGKILADFIRDFRQFLAHCGIKSQSQTRTFTEYVPPKEEELSLKNTPFQPVYVFDNRKNKTLPLHTYLQLFENMRPDMHFLGIDDLSQVQRPVLVLQDYQQKDFLDKGIFAGEADPYQELYRKYRNLPKQAFNINLLEAQDLDVDEYLSYTLPDQNQLKHKLGTSLLQLALKAILYSDKPLSGCLPFFPENLMYVCKRRNIAGLAQPFETMMYVEDDHLRFLDLRDPEQRIQAQERCLRLGVDWFECSEQMIYKYKREERPQDERALPNYHVIIGPNLFVEIENCKERVLYDYDEIVRRQDEAKTLLPVEMFKLLPHYDTVKNEGYLSLEELQRRGLLQRKKPEGKTEIASLHFYAQLERYDAYLDDIQLEYPMLSFLQLTDDEMPFIAMIRYIFEIKPNKHGKYTNHKFIGYYQKRKWFQSDKAKDVHMYQGIWYDDEHCYMVGATEGMQYQQPRAHLIRRFDVYQGAEHFDIQSLLRLLSVQFVRLNQYTVYPYPFHLIDLFVENILLFKEGQASKERLAIVGTPGNE